MTPGFIITGTLVESDRTLIYQAVRQADQKPVTLIVGRGRDLARLENELAITSRIECAAVPRPLGLTQHEGRPALVAELCQGISLRHLLDDRLEPGRFLALAMSISGALAEVHRHGVIHKDLRPEHILVDQAAGTVKITGFGLACPVPQQQSSSDPTHLEGTLAYMSPEQTGRMNRQVDHRSDLYSLGIVFFEMLTHRLPFQASEPLEWVHCHAARQPPPPAELVPGLPPVLSDLILKLLAKNADDRYQSAAGLRHDLAICLGQWQREQRIAPFELGGRDVPDTFLLNPGIHGREAELRRLLDAFRRMVVSGSPALVMVSGAPGVGKSALVGELQKTNLHAPGFFAAGKCDPYKRNLPYAVIAQAFQDVVSELLAQPEERLASCRQRILEAVGDQGQIVLDLIPSVQLIIGPQPEVTPLPLAETQNRLLAVFGDFVRVLAQPEHPLIIFLDNLQWSDTSTLRLIQQLLQPAAGVSLLLVGAYRSSEVEAGHPLISMLEEAQRAGATVEQIHLLPLELGHLTQLVAGATRRPLEDAEPLAELLHQKTGGNPLFLVQFLGLLHRDGLLRFDPDDLRWRWNLDDIRAKEHAANVVDLLIGKARRLPPGARRALELAACLGNTLELSTLAAVLGRSAEQAREDLWPSLQEGLLLRFDGVYRFAHDRVRQAAYALLADEQRPSVHLRIGRHLLDQAPVATPDERVFSALNHLDLGSALITDREERHRLARLNLQAGRKARASAAWESAHSHFAAGLRLCDEETWRSDYELALALHEGAAETAYLNGEYQVTERLVDKTLRQARNTLDKVRSYQTRIDSLIARKKLIEASRSGLEILELLGLVLPERPSKLHVMARLLRTGATLVRRRGGIDSLLELPEMRSPVALAQMRILESIASAVYLALPDLMPLVALTGTDLSIRHGNSAEAPFFYAGYGLLLCAALGDFDHGYRFGKLALKLLERGDAPELTARIHFVFNDFIRHTREPLPQTLEPLLHAYRSGVASGDFEYAARSLWVHSLHLFLSGERLGKVAEVVEAAAQETQRLKQGTTVAYGQLLRQLVANLVGETADPCRLTGQHLDETRMLQTFAEANDRYALSTLHYFKMFLHYLFNDHERARAEARQVEPAAITSLCYMYQLYFYDSLIALAGYPEASRTERLRILARTSINQRRLKKWATFVPATHLHRYQLVAAEQARVSGRRHDAVELYDQAIESASSSGYLYEEALARERAGEHHLSLQHRGEGLRSLLEARHCYAVWGALAKVRQLDARYPDLRQLWQSPGGSSAGVDADRSTLDLSSVVKAAQAISQEIVLDRLIGTLLHVAIENAGAQRGYLVLNRDDRLRVEAEARVEGQRVRIGTPPAAELGSLLPASIINYVKRSRQAVILDDATRDNPYSSDPYLLRRKPLSVLCLPIVKQGRLIGILYLENQLVSGAFQPSRAATLELLATQAAISLESALAFEREQAARAQAETAERRSAFLAEASRVLGESLDYEGTVQKVVRLALPALADWCVVDLLDQDGHLERVAAAHVDQTLEPLLNELLHRYPPSWESPQPTGRVLREGKPLHLVRPAAPEVRALARDDQHFEMLQRLGVGELLAIPLVARGRTFGVLGLCSSRERAPSGPNDLSLAMELGGRIAMAIDNASLYRRAELAVRVRDEFLSVASHELSTPMTSLLLTLQGLDEIEAARLTPEVIRQLVTIARRQGERLSRLTQALLDVTRIERGRLSLELEELELVPLVQEVVTQFSRELEQAGCTATIGARGPVKGRWDRSRIEQVVSNLISNAVKFGPGKPIAIDLEEEQGLARLAIRDQGIGIESSQQQRIFQRYGRAVSTKHYGGLGLGLYICRRIANAHGGSIHVESAIGHGATFVVELPCAGPVVDGPFGEEEVSAGPET